MKKQLGILVLMVTACASAVMHAQEADETMIRQVIRAQEAGWNTGDARAYAASFQAEGVFTIIVGTTYRTREALAERVGQILATIFKGSVLTHRVRGIRVVRPEVAVVDLETEMTGFVALPPGILGSPDGKLRTTMLQVMVKDAEGWRVAAFHNVDRTVP